MKKKTFLWLLLLGSLSPLKAQDTIPFLDSCFAYPQIVISKKFPGAPGNPPYQYTVLAENDSILYDNRCHMAIGTWSSPHAILFTVPHGSRILGIADATNRPVIVDGISVDVSYYDSTSAGLQPIISVTDTAVSHKEFVYMIKDSAVTCRLTLFDDDGRAVPDRFYLDVKNVKNTDDYYWGLAGLHLPYDVDSFNNGIWVRSYSYFTTTRAVHFINDTTIDFYTGQGAVTGDWVALFPILQLPCPAPGMVAMELDSLGGERFSWHPGADTTLFQLAFLDNNGSTLFVTDPIPDTSYTLTDSVLTAAGIHQSGLLQVRLRKACDYTNTPQHTLAWSQYGRKRTFYHSFNTTGLAAIENSRLDIELYPNPARDKVTVEVGEWNTESRWMKAQVMDMEGCVVESFDIQDPKSELDISAIPAGIYLIRFTTSQGFAARKLVVTE